MAFSNHTIFLEQDQCKIKKEVEEVSFATEC